MGSLSRSLLRAAVAGVLMAGSACGSVRAAEWPAVHGFLETAFGARLESDTTKRDGYTLAEQRLQLKTVYFIEGENYWTRKGTSINAKGDFTLDEYFGGKTGFELRELNAALTPYPWLDARAGRQILTWGTGDYVFVNDQFPKDYVSFFSGRDDEYLKKPSDALRLSIYPPFANMDVVVSRFEPNTTAKGDRLSFYDSFQGGIAGTASDRQLREPPLQFSNNEYAMRIYRHFGSQEAAFYYFHGFDKNPSSFKNEAERQLFYPRLDVYGASLRGPFAGGIGNVEFGYVYSREDSDGSDRLIANSMVKWLTGYTRDLGQDWRIGFQHLYEQRLNYDAYQANALSRDLVFDEFRHVLTQRITKSFRRQTVTVTVFNFYSPTDKDGYVRPSVSYDVTDQWKVTLGASIPWGEDDFTEFGQMKRNKNIYARVRYAF